ncbi:GNAT family N-acetyltransferase [Alishewanella sp. HL-SH06]|uniref:GNAT family N-acetyltransferase n=1 Tax=Alishewanella sp. HL-SH06 TaxID=3461144 RepID=UPI0040432E40
MFIRSATESDIDSVVILHIKAFEGFFLTSLGKSFLRKLYQAFLFEESGVFRVITDDDGNIIGFAAGTTSPDLFFSSLRKKKWLSFLISSIPGVLNQPIKVLRKLYHAMFYKGDKPAELLSSALLSSIAVLPEMTGKSLGKELLLDFEKQVKSMNVASLYLTTDKFGNDSVVAFYTKTGYQIESDFTQPNGRKMLRLIKFF